MLYDIPAIWAEINHKLKNIPQRDPPVELTVANDIDTNAKLFAFILNNIDPDKIGPGMMITLHYNYLPVELMDSYILSGFNGQSPSDSQFSRIYGRESSIDIETFRLTSPYYSKKVSLGETTSISDLNFYALYGPYKVTITY